MPTSRTLGELDLPQDFPAAEFDSVNKWMADHTQAEPRPSHWFAFASAWNAVAYRLVGAIGHGEAFHSSISRAPGPTASERYLQDHDLFAFTQSAASAIECYCFACHSLGHGLSPQAFPQSAAKDLWFYPDDVLKRFHSFAPGDPLVAAISATLSSREYDQLKTMRDVLAHRGTPPRRHFLGGADERSKMPDNLKDLAANWVYEFALTDVNPLQKWLQSEVSNLVVHLARFCMARP